MSERGVFAVDRGIWDHPSFADEPLTEREAWQWLIGEAAFKDRVRRVGSVVVELVRGQLAASTRFMADKWQWSEARVRRFLKRLKTDAMIDAASDAGITVITICNYNKYQRVSLPSDAAAVAQTDAAATQQRRKTEDTKTIEVDSEAKASEERAPVDDGWPANFREEFWNRYPHKVGKPRALKKLEGIRKRAVLVSFEALMAGLDQYMRTKPPDRQWMNPETFLNGERWNDQPAKVENGKRTGNPRTTGHDAILAAATRAAGKIIGDGAMAGADDTPEFPERHGFERCGTTGRDDSVGRTDEGHDRGESGADGVLEGEIITPDKTTAGLSDRRQLF